MFIRPSDVLRIAGLGEVSACAGDVSIAFEWTLYENHTVRDDLISVSNDRRIIQLPAYTLRKDAVLTAVLNASTVQSFGTFHSSASVKVVVISGDVVAIIKGNVDLNYFNWDY